MPSEIVPMALPEGQEPTNWKGPRMNKRDARLRNELVGIVILKICILAGLWWAFVYAARVPVDTEAMARQTTTARALSETGEPNGH